MIVEIPEVAPAIFSPPKLIMACSTLPALLEWVPLRMVRATRPASANGCAGEAVQIPAGHTVTLEKGSEVIITQSLGGTYSVQVPAYGGLFRIAGRDADAIGKPVVNEPAPAGPAPGDLEQQVWEVLKTCYDPEIPVNIVDLGLV